MWRKKEKHEQQKERKRVWETWWLKCTVQEGMHGQQVERAGEDESRGRMVEQTWMPRLLLSR